MINFTLVLLKETTCIRSSEELYIVINLDKV